MHLGATIPLEDLVDLGLTAGHLSNIGAMSDEELAAEGRRYSEAGIIAVQTGGYCNLISTDENHRRDCIANLRSLLTRAERAGCRWVVVGGGHRDPAKPTDIFSAHPDNWTAEARALLAESCAAVLDGWSSATTGLVVETWVMTPLDSPAAARQLADTVNHRNFGILFDPVNMMNLDRHFRSGAFIGTCFDTFGDQIRLVHLKDTLIKAESFTYHMAEVPIGDGNLDIGQLLREADGLDEGIPLVIEHLAGFDAYAQAVSRMREIAAKNSLSFVSPRQSGTLREES